MRLLASLWQVNRGLLVLLSIVLSTGIVNLIVPNQRAFLNFYYLPVVFGTYVLGRSKGMLSALISIVIVYTIAIFDPRRFGFMGLEAWMRWLDLFSWGVFLMVTAYAVGSLYELKESQLREIRQAYAGILEIMGKFIDSMDRYTENHSRRVAELAVEISRGMRLPEDLIEDIRVGAYLHDIGKVDISTEVLRKAAGLTPEEFAEMQTHVDKGEALVRSVGGILKNVIPMVAFHHERWDGTGYKGLRGDQIPLGARIIAVADTYDAIVTSRAYRAARSHDEAIEIIRMESGKQFDPAIVSVFTATFANAQPEATRAAA